MTFDDGLDQMHGAIEDDAYRRGYRVGVRTYEVQKEVQIERLRIVLLAVRDALSDDTSTYGERCDVALELINKSKASSTLPSQQGNCK
jgi:hypothetical protein